MKNKIKSEDERNKNIPSNKDIPDDLIKKLKEDDEIRQKKLSSEMDKALKNN